MMEGKNTENLEKLIVIENNLVEFALLNSELRDLDKLQLFVHSYLIYKLVSTKQKLNFNPFFLTKDLDLMLTSIIPDVLINEYLNALNTSNKIVSQLLEQFHEEFFSSRFIIVNGKPHRKKSKQNLREVGTVYTQEKITDFIVSKSLTNWGVISKEQKILDFGSGFGRFYFSSINFLEKQFQCGLEDILTRILYAVDIDSNSLNILIYKILVLLQERGIQPEPEFFKNIFNANMLIPEKMSKSADNLAESFNEDWLVFDDIKFDIVVSNPPYYLLKVNKRDNGDHNQGYHEYLLKKVNFELDYFRNSGRYRYSIEGMLNYFKLSIERIIKIVNEKGEIGVICPSTIFGDQSSKKLRKHLLFDHKLREIHFYPESARLFDNISQATSIFFLQKNGVTDKININYKDRTFPITKAQLIDNFPTSLEIPQMPELGWKILEKLSKFKRLKDLRNVRNRRGELDLSLKNKYLTTAETNWNLIKGNMISSGKIDYSKLEYYVTEDFFQNQSKLYLQQDRGKVRLISQQISNIDMKQRLNFALCGEKDVLGNSVNYISSDNIEILKKLRTIFNSSILNWRFKITSTNNHISNYEIGELPIPDLENISENHMTDIERDIKIAQAFHLTEDEIKFIHGENN